MATKQIEKQLSLSEEIKARIDRLCSKHEFTIVRTSTNYGYKVYLLEYSQKRDGFDDRTFDNLQRLGTIMDLDLKKRSIELWIKNLELEEPEPVKEEPDSADIQDDIADIDEKQEVEYESGTYQGQYIENPPEIKTEPKAPINGFEIYSKSAKELKAIFKAIATITDEVTLVIGPEGLSVRTMDPSHIALLDLKIPNSAFDAYEADRENKIGLKVDEIIKILADFDDKEAIEISLSDQMLNLKSEGSTVKTRLIESSTSDCPLPKLNFNAKITLDCKAFEKIIKSVGKVSEYVTITSLTRRTAFSGRGDSGEISMDAELVDSTIKEESKATYSLSYIARLHAAFRSVHKEIENVTLEYSTKMPLRLEYKIMSVGKLHFYLAPRVQD